MFKPKPALPAAPPAVADAEFLEAVAKTWRQRYQEQHTQPGGPPRPEPHQEQAA